jgi:hypothetical protein
MMHAIRCGDVQERLEEFHDDELTLEQRVAIQSHLHDCVTCSLVAAELADLRHSLREAAWRQPDRDAPEAERLPRQVIERLRVEDSLSLEAELKALFQDMHFVWAALGATAAMLFCLIGSISVLHAANQERPDSLAGLITFLANPGSNENPVRLDERMLAPRTRVDEGSAPLPVAGDGDAVFAMSAVVTREGRIQNLELLNGDRPLGERRVRPDVLLAMLQKASLVEFEPAKSTPTGDPVAVSMVWVLANTIVKGRPSDDVILTRRPPTSTPALVPTAPKPIPVGLGRPATNDGALS